MNVRKNYVSAMHCLKALRGGCRVIQGELVSDRLEKNIKNLRSLALNGSVKQRGDKK
jgi:hypothetical protein